MRKYYSIKSYYMMFIQSEEMNDLLYKLIQTYIQYEENDTITDIVRINFKKILDLFYSTCYNRLEEEYKGKAFFFLPNKDKDYFTVFITEEDESNIPEMRTSIVEDIHLGEDFSELLLRNISM